MLNLFEDLGVPEDVLHTKFKIIRDGFSFTGEQLVLNDWVDGFQDRDNKIVKEFQTTFHSAFWEFYLYAFLKKAGFYVDFSRSRPDFIIKSPIGFYMEAVVSNIKKEGQKEDSRTMNDILSMIKPYWQQEDFDENLRESITRYSSAFLSKDKKHGEYSKDPCWDSTAPYVIALCGYERINYGSSYNHAMLALLYGMYIDPKSNKYSKKQTVSKPDSNAPIPIGLFLNDKYSHVSAVIFSCTITLGKLTSLAISQKKSSINFNAVMCVRHDGEEPKFKVQVVSPESPEYLTDGVFVFHNPFAINPLPKEMFDETNVIHYELDVTTETLSAEGNNLPIISRLNLAGGHDFIESIVSDVQCIFNPDLVFFFVQIVDILEGDEVENYYVVFQDHEDSTIKFTLSFDSDALSRYHIGLYKEFCVIFSLPRNYSVTNLFESEIDGYKKSRKMACVSLGLGQIVYLQEKV